jgi:transposase
MSTTDHRISLLGERDCFHLAAIKKDKEGFEKMTNASKHLIIKKFNSLNLTKYYSDYIVRHPVNTASVVAWT